MLYLQLQLPIFVLALIANIALAIVVLQYATKDRSRTLFCLFVIAQMFWITANYFAFQVPKNYFLFVSRLTMFFATFHALFFYLFIDNFLDKRSANYKGAIIPTLIFGCVVAVLTLTPLVFSHLAPDKTGHLAPQTGPFIAL